MLLKRIIPIFALFVLLICAGCSSQTDTQAQSTSTPSVTVAPATATAQALDCIQAAVKKYMDTNRQGVQYTFDGYLPSQSQVVLVISTPYSHHEHIAIQQKGTGCQDWVVGS